MSRKTLIFDFDGTIADSLEMIYNASNDILRPDHGQKLTSDEIETLKDKGVKNALRELNVSVFKFPFLILKIQVEMYKRISEVELFPGIDSVLIELDKDFDLGILTNNRKKTVEKFLRENQIDLFDFVITNFFLGNKSKKLKKKSKKGAIAYVGDQASDMIAAKEAGLSALGVGWGFDSKKMLREAGADFIAEKPEDVLSFFKN